MTNKNKKTGALKPAPIVHMSRVAEVNDFLSNRKDRTLGWRCGNWEVVGHGENVAAAISISVTQLGSAGDRPTAVGFAGASPLLNIVKDVAAILFPGMLGDGGKDAEVKLAGEFAWWNWELGRPEAGVDLFWDERETPGGKS